MALAGAHNSCARKTPMTIPRRCPAPSGWGSRRPGRTRALGRALLLTALVACPARAADRIYWCNTDIPMVGDNIKIGFANLDGSGGGDLPIPGTAQMILGIALDPAGGRIYFTYADDTIRYMRFDGSGGDVVPVTGATLSAAEGLAIDHAARRIYWVNRIAGKVSFANLDTGSGGDLVTPGATVLQPKGVVVDPGTGRVYWTNADIAAGQPGISFAKLDGSGGGDLPLTGATLDQPIGLTIDPGAQRVYWGNAGGTKISVAGVDGTNASDLSVSGATVFEPIGMALDPVAGRIYWANYGVNKLSFANLDGSNGADVSVTNATVYRPGFVSLLDHPTGDGPPDVTGEATVGSTLSCSDGSWAPDVPPSSFYRAPESLAFQWSRGGVDIGSATARTVVASAPGDYRCRVTATNAAGSSSQTSAPVTVMQPTFGTETLVSLSLTVQSIPAKGPLQVKITNANGFQVSGMLSGQALTRVGTGHKRRLDVATMPFTVAANADTTADVTLKKALRGLLRHKHKKWTLRLSAAVEDPAGQTRTVTLDAPAS